jgi:serpin B
MVGEVFHKAFVEVNEEGTEASAASMMMMSNCLKKKVSFVVDRPFVFVIYSTSLHCPLFIGKVVEVCGE